MTPDVTSRARRRCVSAAILLIPFVGCGDDATGPTGGAVGSGSAEVTGALSLSFSGSAVAGGDGLSGSSRYGVSISSDASDVVDIVFVSGRPGPGTYAIAGSDSEVYGELVAGSDLYVSFFGEVIISSSSSSAIAGSATFSALKLGTLEQASVTVEFNATCFAVPGLITCP